MRISPKKKPKSLHPSLIKAKEALEGKTAKPIIKRNKVEKAVVPVTTKVIDFYKGYRSSHNKEMIQSKRDNMAEALVLWSLRPDSVEITDFCMEYDVTEASLEILSRRHEVIKEARDTALDTIMARREKGALFMEINGKRVNSSEIKHYQGQQSRRFRKMREWEASLRKDDGMRSGNFDLHFYDQAKPKGDDEPNDTNTPK